VAYSNSGPPLAAYVVEKIEGKPFEQVVQERLFEPLGMRTATYLHPDTTQVALTKLYRADGRTEAPYWHPILRPAGSVNASAEDMARYLRFLLDRGRVDGRHLLPPAAIDRLERSEASLVARAGLPVGYGLHTARYVDSGFVWTGHDGGVEGGLTGLGYLPEHGIGYAFMINRGSREAFDDIERLVRGFITKDLPRPVPPPPAAMPAGLGARFTGWYRPDNPRAQHFYFVERLLGLTRVSAGDSTLTVAPLIGRPRRYLPVTETTFRGDREPVATLALVRDSANGRPNAIERMGYLLPTSLVRVATPVAVAEIVLVVLWALGTVVTVLVALAGVVRLVFRRGAVSPARVMWRVALGTSASLLAALGLFALTALRSPFDIGRPVPAMVGAYLLLWLFAVLGALGAVLALRPTRDARGGLARGLSLWSARVVAVTNLIAAAYLLYWGVVGWRTWA
jgi:hypothetical protein